MLRYDTVIFDLDGTLLNTLDDLSDSVNAALDEFGFPNRTRDEVRRFVGNGVARLMALSVPEGERNPRYLECLERFRAIYSRNMRRRTAPYDGVMSLLSRLTGAGVRLAVVSNKPDAAVKALCRHFFGEALTAALGETDGMKRKPAPDILEKALRVLGSAPALTVYVGDSEVDVRTANNACVAFVGAAWGFRDRETLLNSGAGVIIGEPLELCDIVKI